VVGPGTGPTHDEGGSEGPPLVVMLSRGSDIPVATVGTANPSHMSVCGSDIPIATRRHPRQAVVRPGLASSDQANTVCVQPIPSLV
jgi:hypothetical protein